MQYFFKVSTLAALLTATSLIPTANAQAAEVCELDRPIIFAGLDWDSNTIHTEIASFILEQGYNCSTDIVPGTTFPLLNGQIRGDIDITMEIWRENVRETYDPAVEAGKVIDLGVNYSDAVQGWFVPTYLVSGPDAPAPDLKSVFDLPKYKDLFADPEEPGKGRFYNGVAGWSAEEASTKKFYAYNLDQDYVNFRAGSGSALVGAAEAALLRKRPVLFYYWGPTWFLGKVGDQLTMLEEPEFDQKIWEAMLAEQNPEAVEEATAFPVIEVSISASPKLVEAAPKLVEFFTAYETTGTQVSELLAWMQDNDGTAKEAALHFLNTEKELWHKWVPADVASNVDAAL